MPGAQALRTRAMLSAALTACERPMLPWKGSVGAGDREGVKSSARWCKGAGEEASIGLNWDLCGHCSSHSAELGQI